MALLSPGVSVKETNLSYIANTASSNIGALAGYFTKGPVDTVQQLTSVTDLISNFGLPTDVNYNDWYQCYEYLLYTNNLLVGRAVSQDGNYTASQILNLSVSSTPAITASGSYKFSLAFTGAGLANVVVNSFVTFGKSLTDGSTVNIFKVTAVNTINSTLTLIPYSQVGYASAGTVEAIWNVNGSLNLTAISAIIIASNNVYNIVPAQNASIVIGASAVSEATSGPQGSFIKNNTDFNTQITSLVSKGGMKFIAKNPGSWGNKISIITATTIDFTNNTVAIPGTGITINSLFQYSPTATQMAVVILNAGEVVETFLVSTVYGATDFQGQSTYIEDVINSQSNYVYVINPSQVSTLSDVVVSTNFLGFDGVADPSDIELVYDLFADKEVILVDLVIANEACRKYVMDLCTLRGDCIAVVGARFSDCVGKNANQATSTIITDVNSPTGTISEMTEFASFYANYGSITDNYNGGKNRWISLAGNIAGCMARSSDQASIWAAPAGNNRGILVGINSLAFIPAKAHRDNLFQAGANPVTNFGGGIVIWGDKTKQIVSSMWDQVSTRRGTCQLERSLSALSKNFIFEQNDSFLQQSFKTACKPLFETAKALRGITNYVIQCDSSNNNGMEPTTLNASFYIQFTGIARFIAINIVSVNGSVSLSTVVQA